MAAKSKGSDLSKEQLKNITPGDLKPAEVDPREAAQIAGGISLTTKVDKATPK